MTFNMADELFLDWLRNHWNGRFERATEELTALWESRYSGFSVDTELHNLDHANAEMLAQGLQLWLVRNGFHNVSCVNAYDRSVRVSFDWEPHGSCRGCCVEEDE